MTTLFFGSRGKKRRHPDYASRDGEPAWLSAVGQGFSTYLLGRLAVRQVL
jgi:hypothetical protein